MLRFVNHDSLRAALTCLSQHPGSLSNSGELLGPLFSSHVMTDLLADLTPTNLVLVYSFLLARERRQFAMTEYYQALRICVLVFSARFAVPQYTLFEPVPSVWEDYSPETRDNQLPEEPEPEQ